MALSRPLLLALLGAVLLGATFFAVQNARDKSSETPSTTTDSQSQPAGTPAQPTELSPEQALEAAFSGEGLKSASFDGTVAASARGQSASVNLDGAFDIGAPTEVPKIEVNAQVRARGATVEGGFISLGDRAYFTQGDVAYRVSQNVWDQVVAARKTAPSRPTPKPLPLPVDPRSWLRELKSSDGRQIDGVETTRVSATVDAGAAMRDLLKVATASGQLPQSAVPSEFRGNVEKAVKRAEFDVYVGTEDKILRRLTADLELSVPGEGKATVELDFDLTAVNKPQTIDAPAHVERGAPSGLLGEFANGFLTGLTTGLGVDQTNARLDAASANNPQKLQRAVRDHRKVVLFFWNPRGLDDRAVAAAVRSVDRTTKAVVLTDRVENVERYGSLVEDLGVSQPPAVVVVDRRGGARLVEGYVDPESLAQVVADAR
jgi:hypothetical protein